VRPFLSFLSIMFVAVGDMTNSGRILARGGNGHVGSKLKYSSGGSGGAILLAAPSIRIDKAAKASVKGGDGQASGGGGRAALYARAPVDAAVVEVQAGKGNRPGEAGTFRHFGDGGKGDLTFLLVPPGTAGKSR
jgi:hypothetical protein